MMPPRKTRISSNQVARSAVRRDTRCRTQKFFVSVAILFLIQILAGLAMAQYYADRSSFFGLDLLNILPFNVLKAVHIQTAIFWIAISWIGGGLFLASLVSRKERFPDVREVLRWRQGAGR